MYMHRSIKSVNITINNICQILQLNIICRVSSTGNLDARPCLEVCPRQIKCVSSPSVQYITTRPVWTSVTWFLHRSVAWNYSYAGPQTATVRQMQLCSLTQLAAFRRSNESTNFVFKLNLIKFQVKWLGKICATCNFHILKIFISCQRQL